MRSEEEEMLILEIENDANERFQESDRNYIEEDDKT